MQTVTKAIYTSGEIKTQKVKKADTDYSGLIVGGLFLAIALTVFILSAFGIIHN